MSDHRIEPSTIPGYWFIREMTDDGSRMLRDGKRVRLFGSHAAAQDWIAENLTPRDERNERDWRDERDDDAMWESR